MIPTRADHACRDLIAENRRRATIMIAVPRMGNSLYAAGATDELPRQDRRRQHPAINETI